MVKLTNKKIILITKKTRLENLIVRYNTIQQAQFVIEHAGIDFSDYLNEDKQYKSVVNCIISSIEKLGNLHIVNREFLPNYIFDKEDIIVVVGQDGLVANTLKYLENQPLIGVNPDPERWDGVLLPFKACDVEKIVTEVLRKKRRCEEITLAQIDTNDGQKLYAVNDCFIGQKTHVSARYIISYDDNKEQQSSSGIIVSTGLGSTGWFKSILAGASGVASNCFSKKVELKQKDHFLWNSKFLYFTVREPYPSNWTSADIVFGKIDFNHSFKVTSQMAENGIIFSDGVESDYLEFNSGTEAIIKIADKKGMLVV